MPETTSFNILNIPAGDTSDIAVATPYMTPKKLLALAIDAHTISRGMGKVLPDEQSAIQAELLECLTNYFTKMNRIILLADVEARVQEWGSEGITVEVGKNESLTDIHAQLLIIGDKHE